MTRTVIVENNICDNIYLHSGAVLYTILFLLFMEFLSFGIYFSLLVIIYVSSRKREVHVTDINMTSKSLTWI